MNDVTQDSKTIWQRPIILFGLVSDLIILDQLSKYAIREWFDLPIMLVSDWFRIVFVENKGIAFSLPVPGGVSSVLAVGVSLYLGHQIMRGKHAPTVKVAYN